MVAGNVERRSMGALGRMGIVAGAHAALILLVGRGLGIVPPLIDDKPDDLITTIVDEHPIRDDFPPTLDPKRETLTIRVPMPEDPPFEPDVRETTIVAQPDRPGDIDIDTGPGSNTIADFIGVRQDARHPLSQPRYPSPDIREGNEGNADVEVYVLPNGRVGDARIARSSGFERLDQSAIEEAKRNWRLVPASRGGAPIAQWYKVRVTFKLTNR
jgi:periplasmic protein TonB